MVTYGMKTPSDQWTAAGCLTSGATRAAPATARFTYGTDLKAGDQVSTAAGRTVRIAGLRVYAADVTAYNLTVEGIHTYYAGATAVLVHNSCGDEAAEAAEDGAAALNRAGREYPRVLDPRSGEPISYPGGGLSKVPVEDRVPWGAQQRAAYIK